MINAKLLFLILLIISFKLPAQSLDTANKNSTAVLDKKFIVSSEIEINSLTKFDRNNLVVLGELWGFLKYHHPAVGKGFTIGILNYLEYYLKY